MTGASSRRSSHPMAPNSYSRPVSPDSLNNPGDLSQLVDLDNPSSLDSPGTSARGQVPIEVLALVAVTVFVPAKVPFLDVMLALFSALVLPLVEGSSMAPVMALSTNTAEEARRAASLTDLRRALNRTRPTSLSCPI